MKWESERDEHVDLDVFVPSPRPAQAILFKMEYSSIIFLTQAMWPACPMLSNFGGLFFIGKIQNIRKHQIAV
jgi:hypothetical protein